MLSLLIRDDSGERELALIGDLMVLGRARGTDIVLEHVGVSRRHLQLRREGFTWWLEDLGSANGTVVNDQLVRTHELAEGDVLRIGAYPHPVSVIERRLDSGQLATYAALQLATDPQRLVHADDLEQRGELDLANWVRAEVELRSHEPRSEPYRAVQRKLAELARVVSPHLRALVSRGAIEGCAFPPCSGQWSKLALGARPRTRSCLACQKTVTYCDTTAEGLRLFPAPIVVDPSRERSAGDTTPMPTLMPVG